MQWRRSRALVATTVAFAALAACNADETARVETLREVLDRVVPRADTGAPRAPEAEPGSYRITLDRYVAGQTGDEIVGTGDDRRQALEPTEFTRDVTRPFDVRGDVNRSLGFVREVGAAVRRVTFLRPLPDDPRPRIYPPQSAASARRLTIAGRDCETTVVGEEEFCIDDAGLVLMTRGKASLEIATEVTVEPAPKPAADLTASLAEGFTDPDQGSVRPIHPETAPPGTDYSLDAPPAGFEFVGRYAVAPLTKEVLQRSSRKVVAGIVDVYVRGIDSVVVERGGKLDISTVDEIDLGSLVGRHAVDLGSLGQGEAGIGGFAPFGYREVRAFPATGKYIVVAGTLPEAELVAIARSLRSWPGSTIAYLDES